MSAGTVHKHIVQASLCDTREGRRCCGESRGSCQSCCEPQGKQPHLHARCDARDLVEPFCFQPTESHVCNPTVTHVHAYAFPTRTTDRTRLFFDGVIMTSTISAFFHTCVQCVPVLVYGCTHTHDRLISPFLYDHVACTTSSHLIHNTSR
jgi:hypothetical protein